MNAIRRAAAVCFVLLSGCDRQPTLTAGMPLHLEDHIDGAAIIGSELPPDPAMPIEWHFDELQPWRPVVLPGGRLRSVETSRTDDALRLSLTEDQRRPGGRFIGLLSIDLPDYRLADWGSVLIRARTSDMVGALDVLMNLYERADRASGIGAAAAPLAEQAPIVGDGRVHTYAFRIDRLYLPDRRASETAGADIGGGSGRRASRDFPEPLRQLVIAVYADRPSTLDILSITLVPAEAAFAEAQIGVRTESEDMVYRRTLYVHAPGRLDFPVRIPDGGQLSMGLGVVRDDVPVTFRVVAALRNADPEVLLEETQTSAGQWKLRTVDLSHLAGRDVTLSLETDADRSGTVALWAAPTVSGSGATERPNIIFYVIDGGSADRMSVYGHNRRTTPNLERLAAEGALFENAYSNSTHTEASTPSFVTSLHTSVLRGDGDSWRVPLQEVSMAERLHSAGYQTALFTANPHAGWYSGLERGFDVLRDALPLGVNEGTSSVHHDRAFRSWREAFPGAPYMVHVQTTDVHAPWASVPPFAGLYLHLARRERASELDHRRWEMRNSMSAAAVYEEAGVDVPTHLSELGALYDEAMAHQDFQIGQLVKRLKAAGEWEHTLLIVAADHSHWAGGLQDPALTAYDPMFRSAVTRIPLLIVWPGRIAGGQRFTQPVSMIDVMPTIMDLAGLPSPEVMQGQSFAPLLLGEKGWEPRPVILDEFVGDAETGELTGVIEVIDGRWGASLLVEPRTGAFPESKRDAPLLLYDLWNDPRTLRSLHEERPDLVKHYRAFLEAELDAHRSLAKLFTRSDPLALTPQQLQALRALGYIR